MPTNFPTSVDNFTNPTANDSLNLPSHSTQHANANDAIEAVEDYLLNGAGKTGLVFIKSQTIGTTVSSVTVTDAFSATYNNYLIQVSGGVASTDNYFNLTLGSTATGYYRFYVFGAYNSATVGGSNAQNAASVVEVVYGSTSGSNGSIEIVTPFLGTRTGIYAKTAANSTARAFTQIGGYLDNTTSYTSFTLTANTGTFTGGTISVYGYRTA
jgi:hypothetical protein